MENKKVLGKIIPAVLVLVLALLLVIVISSCSKGKKTPVGAIEDKNDYLKINIADDKSYSVSKLEFYNKLRYVGYDVFEDALYEAALNDIVNDIKADIEANSSNLANAKYYKRFQYVIDAEAYGTADEDEIKDLKDDDKEKKEKAYLNTIKKLGYDVNEEKGIYQQASFEYQLIKLAKREYARSVLLKEIDEEDSENKVTKKKIEDYFTKKIVNRGDFSALIILFSSQTEIEDALKQLNLKFIGDKLYRVPAANATYADAANRTFAEYEEYYNDFDGSKEEDIRLDNNEILFELCRMYNYIYSYRPQLKFEINGKDYLDATAYPVNPIADTYEIDDYKAIKDFSLDDMTAMLIAQDTGNMDESPRLNYDYETIYDIDSSLQTAMYTKYLATSKKQAKYNTPSATFARGNYLSFKLIDANDFTYKAVKDLCNLLNGIDNNADEKAISAYIETVKEDYTDRLKAMGIFDDDAKVKAWAVSYANGLKFKGLTGAKDILKSTEDRDDVDSIWSKVFEEMLTDDYINGKLKDHLEDDCKITIYDSLFEAQFAQNYSDIYKAGNKQSKENVLKVKVNDKENVITAQDMFNRLEMHHGAGTASNLLLNQIVKEKYYDKVITDAKKKEYEKEYENILTYFAQGQSSQFGYNPSIGQKAFVNLYFQADNKEEAIFNMWVSRELQDTLVYKNAKDINSNILDYFTTLTNIEASNYTNIEYNLIYAYTDDDEDGEADDWTKVDDSDARKQEVMQLSAQLLNIFNERAMKEFANNNRDGAYNELHSKYQAASRISTIGNAADGAEVPATGFKTTAEQDAYYFAKFKAKGIFLALSVNENIDSVSALENLDDDNLETQVKLMYKYMIDNHSSDLTVDQIFARKLLAEDTGADVDKAASDTIFAYEKGFASFYVYQCTKAPTFTFEEKDNSDTSTGSKVYPYSVNEDDPFPVDEDGKPVNNTGAEDTLYNSAETISINQMIVYMREYKDGVESLSLDVINAFTAYFEEDIMKKYTSDAFKFYIVNSLIKQYEAEGKVTIDEALRAKINTLVTASQESLFDFKDNEFTAKWAELFK